MKASYTQRQMAAYLKSGFRSELEQYFTISMEWNTPAVTNLDASHNPKGRQRRLSKMSPFFAPMVYCYILVQQSFERLYGGVFPAFMYLSVPYFSSGVSGSNCPPMQMMQEAQLAPTSKAEQRLFNAQVDVAILAVLRVLSTVFLENEAKALTKDIRNFMHNYKPFN